MNAEEYVEKITPKKGDILVFKASGDLLPAQQMFDAFCELTKEGKLDPEIPVVVIYGKDKFEVVNKMDLIKMGMMIVPIPKQEVE